MLFSPGMLLRSGYRMSEFVRLRITGEGAAIRVVDAETGEDYAMKLGIRGIRWTCNPGEKPFLSLDLCAETNVEITTMWPPVPSAAT
jgi:hypothetical protein